MAPSSAHVSLVRPAGYPIMTTLNIDTRRQLIEVIKSAYPSHADIQQMLKLQMDENLSEMSGPADTLQTCVFNLVVWAEKRGRVAELVEAALQGNPRNPEMQGFVADVWVKYRTPSKHSSQNMETVCGIAPARSVLEDVHRAFGRPTCEEQKSMTKIVTDYVSQGVRVTCLLSPDRRWIVDLIRLQAPFSKSLSLSGLYIGMPLHEVERACTGKYHFESRKTKRVDMVLEPLHEGNCLLTVVLDADKIATILMQHRP